MLNLPANLCYMQDEWPEDEDARQQIRADFSTDSTVGDRRQELVFIGQVSSHGPQWVSAARHTVMVTMASAMPQPVGLLALTAPCAQSVCGLCHHPQVRLCVAVAPCVALLQDLNRTAITRLLDSCLLSDEELADTRPAEEWLQDDPLFGS